MTCYRSTVRDLYGYAGLLAGTDRAVAEDIVRDTYMSLLARAQRGDVSVVGYGYLRRSVRHRWIDSWRAEGREQPRMAAADTAPATPKEALDDVPVRLLAELPVRARTVMVLRYVEDMPVTAIAEALGTTDRAGLWQEMLRVFLFWVDKGVTTFRVDNPHTKNFYFWEWMIDRIKRDYPETIFLAEAFTRPKVLHYLAKVGFSQSYNYFPWRNTKHELTEYLTQLTRCKEREFLRPNLWPNTPDILTEYLQFGGRPAYMIRLVLAATLGASYGIYGPAFELFENRPREHGSEEYLDSEKYQIRSWDLHRHDSLKDYITRINRIRRENPALQYDRMLRFHSVDNDALICYSKNTEDFTNIILVLVNLDPHHTQSGWVNIPLDSFGLEMGLPYQAHDLLSSARFIWNGPRNFVELNPGMAPAHIFRLRRRVRSEKDFDYYM